VTNEVDPCPSPEGLAGKPEVDSHIDLMLEDVGEAEQEDPRVQIPLEFDHGVGCETLLGRLTDIAEDHVDEANGHRRQYGPLGD